MDLSGTPVAVTGAAGFIGGAVGRALARRGAEVVGVDVRPGPLVTRRADVTDPAGIREALRGARGVVHAAAIVTEWGAMEDFVRVNVRGTRNVLDAAEAAGAERVVHLSSVAIWGAEFRRPVHEDEPGRPCGNPYVDTKWASEALARRRGATIVRPGDVYGPGSAQWARRPAEGLRSGLLRVPGRGEGLLTPVYVDDLAECVVLALTRPEAAGAVVTAWDRPVAVRDFFAPYARLAGRGRVPTIPRAAAHAAAMLEDSVGRLTGRHPVATPFAVRYVSRAHAYRTSRARDLLGWEPRVPLEEGLGRTVEWLRSEGLGT